MHDLFSYKKCNCGRSNINVTLGPFTVERRLAPVERTLGILIESRFGRTRPYALVAELGPRPKDIKCTFYNNLGGMLVPSYEYDCPDPIVVSAVEQAILNSRQREAAARAAAAAARTATLSPVVLDTG